MDTVKNDFCCDVMKYWIEDIDCPLKYDRIIRYYSISAPMALMEKNVVWPSYTVQFCPNCGTHLPNDLVEKRMEILESEYGLNDIYDENQKKLIPEEFKTDLWWKHRGL